jgi:DMSO/TMAO reductase YedYZ molybdopterin-dependent catalytic subunit
MRPPWTAERPNGTPPGSPPARPRWWPTFSSTLRSTALTARLGRVLGIALSISLVTGLLSLYQYEPWSWLPEPASPAWGYRLTQGVHVATGTATIPLVLVKLWSVYPTVFRWPPFPSVKRVLEQLSLVILVGSILLQLTTGFLNVLNWYPFPWDFVSVHHYLAYVVVGSVLLHVGMKLPDIRYGLQTKLAAGDVLTEIPWNENPESHSNAGDLPAPVTPGISRRGVLTAAGVGIGVVVVSSIGQAVTPLERVGLLAVRQPSRGLQGVPVSRTAAEAKVTESSVPADWRLRIDGPRPYTLTLAEIEQQAVHESRIPVAAVEGWSVDANWRGLSLLDVVERGGGSANSHVRVTSFGAGGFRRSQIFGPQLSRALLATHLNGQRLSLDHGYPLRLIAPNRPELLDTKWVAQIEVL